MMRQQAWLACSWVRLGQQLWGQRVQLAAHPGRIRHLRVLVCPCLVTPRCLCPAVKQQTATTTLPACQLALLGFNERAKWGFFVVRLVVAFLVCMR